jgi:hypothetical protein
MRLSFHPHWSDSECRLVHMAEISGGEAPAMDTSVDVQEAATSENPEASTLDAAKDSSELKQDVETETADSVKTADEDIADIHGQIEQTEVDKRNLQDQADGTTMESGEKPAVYTYSQAERQKSDQFIQAEALTVSPELQKSYNAIMSKLSPDERAAFVEAEQAYYESLTAKTGRQLSEDNFAKAVIFPDNDDVETPASVAAMQNQCGESVRQTMTPEKIALVRQATDKVDAESKKYRAELERKPPSDPERQAYEMEHRAYEGAVRETDLRIANQLRGEPENAMREQAKNTLPGLVEKTAKHMKTKIRMKAGKRGPQEKMENRVDLTIEDLPPKRAQEVSALASRMLHGATVLRVQNDVKIEDADPLEMQNFLARLKNGKSLAISLK